MIEDQEIPNAVQVSDWGWGFNICCPSCNIWLSYAQHSAVPERVLFAETAADNETGVSLTAEAYFRCECDAVLRVTIDEFPKATLA